MRREPLEGTVMHKRTGHRVIGIDTKLDPPHVHGWEIRTEGRPTTMHEDILGRRHERAARADP